MNKTLTALIGLGLAVPVYGITHVKCGDTFSTELENNVKAYIAPYCNDTFGDTAPFLRHNRYLAIQTVKNGTVIRAEVPFTIPEDLKSLTDISLSFATNAKDETCQWPGNAVAAVPVCDAKVWTVVEAPIREALKKYQSSAQYRKAIQPDAAMKYYEEKYMLRPLYVKVVRKIIAPFR